MRGLTVLHGISAGGDEERAGYSADTIQAIAEWADGLPGVPAGWTPNVREALWASALNARPRLVGAIKGVPGALLDYAQDVFAYARHRGELRLHVAAQITAQGRGRVLLAHSLGSVAAIDCVGAWLRSGEISALIPRDEWPIAGLITIGSPLGINVPWGLDWCGFRDRAEWALLDPAPPLSFEWVNIADENDLVVTGLDVGVVPDLSKIAGYARLGVVQLPNIDTGGIITSHGGYSSHPQVAQAAFQMMRG